MSTTRPALFGSRRRPARSSLAALFLSLFVLFVAACAEAPPPAPEVDPTSLRSTGQGEVVGYLGDYGSHVWKGIPHAAPPVGELRWRAPRRPAPWAGVREALAQGAFCPQFPSQYGGVEGDSGVVAGSEDCLFLDIYAPKMSAAEAAEPGPGLPVMVWIHGGGNVIGHAGFYDGGRLAQERDVVVVAINYRLGPLGWLHNWALRSGARRDDDVSGNFATLDMIRALEWTRANIAAFGGDPHNVTIFGESAGGTNVVSLLLSPRARGLFQRAIVQSGGTHIWSLAEAEDFSDDLMPGSEASSNEVLLLLLQADGRASDRASAKALLASMSKPEIASYLRGKSAAEFLAVYHDHFSEGGFLRAPLLAGDGIVLPIEPPLERFADASGWNVVPVMLGTNRDEDKLFMFGDPRWVKQWLGFLPRLRDPEGFELQARYSSQMWRARGVDEPAAAMRTVSPAVFAYRFDWDDEPSRLGSDLSQMLGAAHGFEIPFVFGHYDLGKAGNVIFTDANLEGREALASAMMSYWAHFARTGDPGRGQDGTLPPWEAWPPPGETAAFMRLDVPNEGGLTMTPGFATEEAVVARAATDPALSARPDRCAILERVAARSSASLPADCVDATLARRSD